MPTGLLPIWPECRRKCCAIRSRLNRLSWSGTQGCKRNATPATLKASLAPDTYRACFINERACYVRSIASVRGSWDEHLNAGRAVEPARGGPADHVASEPLHAVLSSGQSTVLHQRQRQGDLPGGPPVVQRLAARRLGLSGEGGLGALSRLHAGGEGLRPSRRAVVLAPKIAVFQFRARRIRNILWGANALSAAIPLAGTGAVGNQQADFPRRLPQPGLLF